MQTYGYCVIPVKDKSVYSPLPDEDKQCGNRERVKLSLESHTKSLCFQLFSHQISNKRDGFSLAKVRHAINTVESSPHSKKQQYKHTVRIILIML